VSSYPSSDSDSSEWSRSSTDVEHQGVPKSSLEYFRPLSDPIEQGRKRPSHFTGSNTWRHCRPFSAVADLCRLEKSPLEPLWKTTMVHSNSILNRPCSIRRHVTNSYLLPRHRYWCLLLLLSFSVSTTIKIIQCWKNCGGRLSPFTTLLRAWSKHHPQREEKTHPGTIFWVWVGQRDGQRKSGNPEDNNIEYISVCFFIIFHRDFHSRSNSSTI